MFRVELPPGAKFALRAHGSRTRLILLTILCAADFVDVVELPLALRGQAFVVEPASGDAAPEEAASLAGLSLEDVEKRAIAETLAREGGNKSSAARQLGITRATLHNKLKRYGLE